MGLSYALCALSVVVVLCGEVLWGEVHGEKTYIPVAKEGRFGAWGSGLGLIYFE